MFLVRPVPMLVESVQRFLDPSAAHPVVAVVVLVAADPDSVGLDFALALAAVAADPDFVVGFGSADFVAAVVAAVVAGAVA